MFLIFVSLLRAQQSGSADSLRIAEINKKIDSIEKKTTIVELRQWLYNNLSAKDYNELFIKWYNEFILFKYREWITKKNQ